MISPVSKWHASETPDSLWSIWISKKLEKALKALGCPLPFTSIPPRRPPSTLAGCELPFQRTRYCRLEQNCEAFHRFLLLDRILGRDCYWNHYLNLFCFWYSFPMSFRSWTVQQCYRRGKESAQLRCIQKFISKLEIDSSISTSVLFVFLKLLGNWLQMERALPHTLWQEVLRDGDAS